MLTRRTAMMGAALAALILATPTLAQELNLSRQKVELVAPPFVHPHEQATKQAAKIIEFRMEIEEKEIVIDEQGTKFQAMTFNGSMPGPLMVVHQGDYVDIPIKAWHRIENPGDEPLVFVEVQHGSYFGEDDIERRSDDYGRA